MCCLGAGQVYVTKAKIIDQGHGHGCGQGQFRKRHFQLIKKMKEQAKIHMPQEDMGDDTTQGKTRKEGIYDKSHIQSYNSWIMTIMFINVKVSLTISKDKSTI